MKGAGVGTSYRYGKVFEINGTHRMTVTGNTFWAGRDGILNLNMRDSRASGWVFANNTVDARRCDRRIDVIDTAQPIVAFDVHGGRFSNNRIINLDSWCIAYFSDCHDMDWRSTKWVGPNRRPHQTQCSGNRF